MDAGSDVLASRPVVAESPGSTRDRDRHSIDSERPQRSPSVREAGEWLRTPTGAGRLQSPRHGERASIRGHPRAASDQQRCLTGRPTAGGGTAPPAGLLRADTAQTASLGGQRADGHHQHAHVADQRGLLGARLLDEGL